MNHLEELHPHPSWEDGRHNPQLCRMEALLDAENLLVAELIWDKEKGPLIYFFRCCEKDGDYEVVKGKGCFLTEAQAKQIAERNPQLLRHWFKEEISQLY